MKKVIYRRPESNMHGDARGKVWFHRNSWLSSMFNRSPVLKCKLSWRSEELKKGNL